MYVMAALMAGVVLAAFWLGRNALNGISVERKVLPTDPPHEGETVSVTLTFRNTRTDSHIRTTEQCPFAEPDSEAKRISIFIPAMTREEPAKLDYEVVVDRRGLHEFPPLQLESPAPFGLFRRRRTLNVPTRVLIYPEVKPIRRLALFDRRPSALLSRPRPGTGTELIGVRPYRTGDSPRHIHWRSVARVGQLISKEFADDSQPGLTIMLDLHKLPISDSKHTPFEWAVKIAASIGEDAIRRGYALHLLGDAGTWPPPPGPISRTALMEYLARVQPTGSSTMADMLANNQSLITNYLVCILPTPETAVIEPLLALKHRGIETLTVILDPASFPKGVGSPAGAPMAGSLAHAGFDTRLIQFGTDWASQLQDTPTLTFSRPLVSSNV